MTVRPPHLEPLAARDVYLDAARACILDVGWRRTTLTEVARRAAVSRMTIYRTWADMPTLLGDLMTREWQAVVDASLESDEVVPPPEDAVDRLVAGMLGAVRALRNNELFVRILELDPELILPYLLARRGRSQDHILDVTTQAVRAGQASGQVRAGDPVTIARSVVLAAHGFVLSAHTMVDDDLTETALDAELAELLRRALRP